TPNASLAMMLFGFEASPGATNVPLNLKAEIVKTAHRIDFKGVSGDIAGELVQGNVSVDNSGEIAKVAVDAKTGNVSLPVLLGGLLGWQRHASTDTRLCTVA